MTLSWQDNFSDPPGSPPDPRYWTCCVNGAGGGNAEAEYYTQQNVRTAVGGGLVMEATADDGTYPAYNGPSTVLSGKAWTNGKLAWRYGHLEATAVLPAVPGAWPAIWMLGQNFNDIGWPDCAELDIAEWFGGSPAANDPRANNPRSVSGSLHTPTDNITSAYTIPSGVETAATPHVYSLDWTPSSLGWGVDGVTYQTILKRHLGSWPFDLPQFLILNLAIGGTMGGPVPAPAQLPLQMTVLSVALYNAELYGTSQC
jgi:beta-glucanase (GH16 family)